MKRAILLLTLCFGFGYLSAQDYQVQSWSEAYIPLTNPNVITPSDPDDLVYLLNANFNFSAYGKSFPNKAIADGGVFFLNATYQDGIIVSAHSTDWLARPDTKMAYTLEGNSGSKILKVEFDHVGFLEEFDEVGTQHDFMTVQVWLFENTKKVQFHYGASDYSVMDSLATAAGTDFAGVISISLVEGNVFMHNAIQGTEENPILVVSNSQIAPVFKGIPSDGRVFQLCPTGVCSTASEETAFQSVEIFPNPAGNELNMSLPLEGKYALSVSDTYGRILINSDNNQQAIKMDISALPAGMYFINLTENDKGITRTFVKLPE